MKDKKAKTGEATGPTSSPSEKSRSAEQLLDSATMADPVRTEKLNVPKITRELRRQMTGNTIAVMQALEDGAVTIEQVAKKMGISDQALRNRMNAISAGERKFLTDIGFKV